MPILLVWLVYLEDVLGMFVLTRDNAAILLVLLGPLMLISTYILDRIGF